MRWESRWTIRKRTDPKANGECPPECDLRMRKRAGRPTFGKKAAHSKQDRIGSRWKRSSGSLTFAPAYINPLLRYRVHENSTYPNTNTSVTCNAKLARTVSLLLLSHDD